MLCLFSPYLISFILGNQRRIHSYQIRHLHCRARETYFRTYRSHGQFCTWKRFFFPLIDRLVCTIQSNQTSDALIKYVAQYHILYSGQLEIRFSVHLNVLCR